MTTYEKTGTVASGGALTPASANTRGYLDTNLIIGLAKQDLPPTERTAWRYVRSLSQAVADQSPWHRGHHVRGRYVGTCGQAFSPDRTSERWVCFNGGLYECYDVQPRGAAFSAAQPIPFDKNCRAARQTLQKYGYVP